MESNFGESSIPLSDAGSRLKSLISELGPGRAVLGYVVCFLGSEPVTGQQFWSKYSLVQLGLRVI